MPASTIQALLERHNLKKMNKLILTLIALIGIAQIGSAQVTLGTISGKTFDDDSTTIIPFTRVWVEVGGGLRGVKSDIDGNYKIDALRPGIYILHAETLIEGEVQMSVKVDPDAISTANIIMNNANMFDPVIVEWHRLKIEKDIPKIRLLPEDIEHSPNIRNPIMMIKNATTDIKVFEGTNDVIIRGSRPGDVIYYIDGVKVGSMIGVPGVAVGSLEAYTGGIPAKYGDTMGGVISLETKGYFDLYYAWKARQ